ncbi:hypothetical protein HPB50_018661 [Hyalomma asiaticum]|uniref:Uncharacterized protein n=1 Tax=Hyalomma asiaticum TaxID=266040 RepID=A0ACB7SGQ1_HYAAI|nr:hypothetical protein HPB50_018661 [Hyalomma asiaticum]
MATAGQHYYRRLRNRRSLLSLPSVIRYISILLTPPTGNERRMRTAASCPGRTHTGDAWPSLGMGGWTPQRRRIIKTLGPESSKAHETIPLVICLHVECLDVFFTSEEEEEEDDIEQGGTLSALRTPRRLEFAQGGSAMLRQTPHVTFTAPL